MIDVRNYAHLQKPHRKQQYNPADTTNNDENAPEALQYTVRLLGRLQYQFIRS